MPDRSILDARLAEIDRRLRTIQSGLAPAAEPPPPPEAPEPGGAPAAAAAQPRDGGDSEPEPATLGEALASAQSLTAQLRALRAEHDQVLAAARSLLSQLAEQLGRGDRPPIAPAADDPQPATVSLAAGPFSDAAALRRFAELVRDLPGVGGVEVREFLGGDRAVLDVRVDGFDPGGRGPSGG